MSTLQRKLMDVKKKLKEKMKNKKEEEDFEPTKNSPAFVWIGGFQQKRIAETPEPMSKRKLSFSDDDEDAASEEDENILSPATIELQMAWYKNFHLRFFEDEVTIRSTAKRFRESEKSIEIQSNRSQRQSAMTSSSEPKDFSAQINTFRSFFEPNGPDFKIYDDYHYPEFPTTPKQDLARRRISEYRNLVPGNTPAPPLPPRNLAAPEPPAVYRTYRENNLRLDLNLNFIRKSYSLECLNYSYLL